MNLKKNIAFLFLVCIQTLSQAQIDRYVSPDGSNTNDGKTPENAVATLNKALSMFGNTQGGNIYLAEGIYHEEVLLDGKDNINILPEAGANVVFDGTVSIESQWTLHEGNIYKTPVSQDIWQLFINNKEKVMARWPNTTFDNDEIYDHTKWGHGNAVQGSNGTMVDETASDLGNINNIGSIEGALVVANVGSFRTYVKSVTTDLYDGNKFDYQSVSSWKDKHHYYFLEGKLSFLDADNEWFFGTENGQRYLYAWSSNNGVDLNVASIKGKTQSYAIDIRNAQNITVEGFKFFATTVRIEKGTDVTIKDNVFSYPNCSRRMLGVKTSPLVTSVDQSLNSGTLDNNGTSRNCSFEGNVFEYTDGEALIMSGNDHKIKNNYFHHIDYSCGEIQSIGLSIYTNGRDLEFEHNIMHTLGASATLNLGESADIKYNDISYTGLAQSDGSIVQITKNAVRGSETSHNWLHDSEKYGFRFDAPSQTPCTAGDYGLAHHNVIWNLGDAADNTGGIGMMIKGDYQEIYNNTVFDCTKTDILIIKETCVTTTGETNPNTYTRNNVADYISNHRTNAVSNESDIPGTLSNNVYAFSGQADGQTRGKLRNVLAYDSSKILENRALYDFRPKESNNDLYDQGIVISETVYDGVADANITEGWKGNAPDIGAYEIEGEKWVPGIDFDPVTYPWAWPGEYASFSFLVNTSSESCRDQNNGSITITALQNSEYTTQINGVDYTFTATLNIDNLAPGNYPFCIQTDGFEQCYEVTIAEAASLTSTAIVVDNGIDFSISSGTAPYQVQINGTEVLKTYDTTFSVQTKHGDIVRVKTSQECEGEILEEMNLWNRIDAYPNPTKNNTTIFLPIGQEEISIAMYNSMGVLISKKNYPVSDDKVVLNTAALSPGIYITRILMAQPKTLKIIKQ